MRVAAILSRSGPREIETHLQGRQVPTGEGAGAGQPIFGDLDETTPLIG